MSQLLFLDTNVFLSFFHFSSDDLEALRQLTVLVKGQKVKLLLPDQVIHEFRRNRDGKVAEALRQFENAKLPTQFPRLCQDFPEYGQLRSHLDDYEKARRSLMEKVQAGAQSREFGADKTTEELFNVATVLEITAEILHRADVRYRRGNPPGKQDKRESLGDAINWEALLSADITGDLYMVAEDTDWASPIQSIPFNSYLQSEWREGKRGEVHFYQRLSSFLGEHFPDIKLSSELEKDLVIDELASSRTFVETHRAIAALKAAADFTAPQLNAIVSAYVNNDQVFRIINDADVRDFLVEVLSERAGEVDSGLLEALIEVIAQRAEEDSPLRRIVMSHRPAAFNRIVDRLRQRVSEVRGVTDSASP